MRISSLRTRALLVIALALVVLVILAVRAPIPQPPEYHAFADARTMLGIPRALDVLSNLPFLVVGAYGLAIRKTWGPRVLSAAGRWAYVVFFAGVLLTALGSGYYHLAPTNERLFWDRMPMTIGFMSLFAAQLGERTDPRITKAMLIPLLILGFASVLYWDVTERAHHGDLRPYVFVQGFPIVALIVMLAVYPPRYDGARYLWLTIAFYALAKILESHDARIFALTGNLVSGHALKHLAAGAATAMLLLMLKTRSPIRT